MRIPKRNERGFTVVELLIAVVIEAFLVAGLGTALITTMKGAKSVGQSFDRSTDARTAASYIVSDAQNSSGPELALATSTCTDAHPPVAGTATPIVEFASTSTSSTGVDTAHLVDYLLVGNSLLRRTCQGSSTVSASDRVVASNVGSVTAACAPTANCGGTPTSITVTVNEVADSNGSVYTYSLTGAFRKLGGAGAPVNPSAPQSVILLGSGSTCVNGATGLSMSTSAHITVYGTAVINSTDSGSCNAMEMTTSSTFVAGQTKILQGGSCDDSTSAVCPSTTSYSPAISDPYASLAAPSAAALGLSAQAGCPGGVAQPGVYANTLSVTTSSTCDLQPGVYILNQGISISTSAHLTSSNGGVLLYIAGGSFSSSTSATINISAQTTNPWAGIAIWQAKTDTTTLSFSTSGAVTIDGFIYAPKAAVNMSTSASNPTVKGIVAQNIIMTTSANLVIGTPPNITTASLPNGEKSAPYSQTLAATGGNTPYSWTATGLPGGLSMSAAGAITGTPTATGTFSVVANLTDTTNATDTATLSLVIVAAPSVTTASLPAATYGVAYNTSVAGSGGTGSYSWSATGLPTGLSMSSAGVITGTPTSASSTTAITLTDAANGTANASLVLTVKPTIASVALTNKSGGTAGKMEAGDKITIAYSLPMKVSSFCSTWTTGDTMNQSLSGNSLLVAVANGTTDVITITNSSGCTFNLGSIDTKSSAYVTAATTFGGASGNTSIVWTAGTKTLVITLGAVSGAAATVSASNAPVYTASSALVDSTGAQIGNSPFTMASGKQF